MSHDDLSVALETLSAAHGPAALAGAFHALRRAVKQARRDPEAGRLSGAVQEALAMRGQMKAAGATGADLDRGLEAVLRDAWPKPHGRTEPWHDVCSNCRDYGLVMAQCQGDVTCGRPRVHGPHDYGVPCWCAKGTRFTKKAPSESDAMDRAAKPTRPMGRFGR